MLFSKGLRKLVTSLVCGAMVSAMFAIPASAAITYEKDYSLNIDFEDYEGGQPAANSRSYGTAVWSRWTSESVGGDYGKVLKITGNDITDDGALGFETAEAKSIGTGESFALEFDIYSETGGMLMNFVANAAYWNQYVPFFIPVADNGETVNLKGMTQQMARSNQGIDSTYWQNWSGTPTYTLGQWAHITIESSDLSSSGTGTFYITVEQNGVKQTGSLTYSYKFNNNAEYPFDSLRRVMFLADRGCSVKLDNFQLYKWKRVETKEYVNIYELNYDYDTTGNNIVYSAQNSYVRIYGSTNLATLARTYYDAERGYVLSVTGHHSELNSSNIGYYMQHPSWSLYPRDDKYTIEFDMMTQTGGTVFSLSSQDSANIGFFTPFYIPAGSNGDTVDVKLCKQTVNVTTSSTFANYGVQYTLGTWAHVKMEITSWEFDASNRANLKIKLSITDNTGATTSSSEISGIQYYRSDTSTTFWNMAYMTFRAMNGKSILYDNLQVYRTREVNQNGLGVLNDSITANTKYGKADGSLNSGVGITVGASTVTGGVELIKQATAENKSVNIIIAQYDDDEENLLHVAVTNVIMPASTEGVVKVDDNYIATVSDTIVSGAAKAKLFVLENDTIYPLATAIEKAIE